MSAAKVQRPRGRRKERPAPGSPQEREEARETALRLLGVRERSAAELRNRLVSRGYDRRTVGEVLQALQEAGLQDDQRFARALADEAMRRRGHASAAVRETLRRRGVARDLAEAVAPASPEADEARALEIARGRAARLGGLPPDRAVARVAGFLGRRGFEPRVALRTARLAVFDRAMNDATAD